MEQRALHRHQKRNLTEVPTWRLYDIQRKVIAEIEKDDYEVKFSHETLLEPANMMLNALRTKKTWIG